MERIEKAHNLFKEGYNCCQAVTLAFDDVLPIDFETIKNVSSAFGGGFARTRNLCGAVSAIGMVLGLLNDYSGVPSKDKLDIYASVRNCTDKFLEKNESLICSQLLANIQHITCDYVPSPRTSEYYAKRPCVKFVMDAVQIIEESPIFINRINK